MTDTPYVSADHCLYLRAGAFDPIEPNNLDRIFAGYADPKAPKTLLIHFHGGLVNKAGGVADAEALFRGCYGGKCYPVYFVWESGFLDALWRSLPQIFGEAVFKMLLERVAGFAVGKINQWVGLGGAVRGGPRPPLRPADRLYVLGELDKAGDGHPAFADKDPAATPPDEGLSDDERNAILRQLMTRDDPLRDEAARIAQGMRTPEEVAAESQASPRGAPVQGSTRTLMSPEVIDEMRAPPDAEVGVRGMLTAIAVLKRLAEGVVKVVARVVGRFAGRRDHGIQATLVEEILREFYLGNVGQKVWATMKQDTERAFGDAASFGGAAFLGRLAALCKQAPPARIVLVGHSAGAVYICHFLRAADAVLPPEVKFDVVLMAPACDFDLLADSLRRFRGRIAHFRMFTMHDDLEAKDYLLDVPALNALPPLKKLYPGSLLYFISGVLEAESDRPIVGMERYHTRAEPYHGGNFPAIDSVRSYLGGVANGSVWSVAEGGNGLSCGATHHGAFPDDPAMRTSLAHLLQGGF